MEIKATATVDRIIYGRASLLTLSPSGGGGDTEIVTININNTFHTVEQYAATVGSTRIPTGDGTLRTIDSLGMSDAEIQAQWPLTYNYLLGIDDVLDFKNIISHDFMCISEAYHSLENGVASHVHFTGKSYRVNSWNTQYILIPGYDKVTSSNYRTRVFSFFGNGCAINQGDDNLNLFFRTVTNIADSNQQVTTSKQWYNMNLNGNNSNSGNSLIANVCNDKGLFSGLKIRNLAVGIQSRFALNNTYRDCKFFNCPVGLNTLLGNWIDADESNSISQSLIDSCDFNIPENGVGIILNQAESTDINNVCFQGPNGTSAYAGVYFDGTGSTLSKNLTIRGGRIETNFSEAAFVGLLNDSHIFKVEGVYNQKSDYLISVDGTNGYNRVMIDNMVYNEGGNRWKLKYKDTDGGNKTRFYFSRTKLPKSDNLTQEAPNIAGLIDNANVWQIDGTYKSPVLNQIKEYSPLT